MRRALLDARPAQTNLGHVIASVRGEVSAVGASSCVVDVGGVGYAVTITPEHASSLRVGEAARLQTTLIVREDSMQLFGFESQTEQSLFDSLLTVSGVGPRSAMAVLSHVSPLEVYLAVMSEDDSVFKKVSGIGPKTAKLIVVSLAGKLSALASLEGADRNAARASGQAAQQPATTLDAVVSALTGLGWNEKAATEAVRFVLASHEDAPVSTVLREALQLLGNK